MDYFAEAVFLGVDTILFGVVCNLYYYKRSAIKSIENVQPLEVDRSLAKDVAEMPGKKLEYVCVRGKVKALSSPLKSANARSTYGVIQKFTRKEHVISRNVMGFWSEHERTIQEVFNTIPFALKCGKIEIEVIDAMSADYLDLETISDSYKPASSSLMDHLWGLFSGERHQGLQETEEMVREGALLTGIGELALAEDQKTLRLQPPRDGLPFFITSLPLKSLTKRLENEKQTYKWMTICFGVVGVAIMGMMLRQWWLKRRAQKVEEERRRRLEATRRERRQRARPDSEELNADQTCIVCRHNPKEIILLPCGHVCLCEDCSDDIVDLCPVCRAAIESRSAAYIS